MSKQKTGIEYGGLPERFAAVLLDGIILLPFSALLAQMLSSVQPLGFFASFVLNIVYYVGFLSGPWRATPGKRALNLYVVSTRGVGAVNKEQALFRFVVSFVPQLPLLTSFLSLNEGLALSLALYAMWAYPILITRERMAIHDKMCDTRVMKGQL